MRHLKFVLRMTLFVSRLGFVGGILFGAIYGMLYAIIGTILGQPGFAPQGVTLTLERLIPSLFLSFLLGCLWGGVFGSLFGIAAGFIEGIVLGLVSSLAIESLIDPDMRRYRSIVGAIGVSICALIFLLSTIFFLQVSRSDVPSWIMLVLLPSLIAIIWSWYIRNMIAAWMEKDIAHMAVNLS